MGRALGVLLVAACVIGCANNNKITILNHADEQIMFDFRAKVYTVGGDGQTLVIDDIPNGTYTYATTYTIPAGTKSTVTTGDLGGEFSFVNRSTEVHITYSSALIEGAYNIGAVWTSSNNNNSGANPVSP